MTSQAHGQLLVSALKHASGLVAGKVAMARNQTQLRAIEAQLETVKLHAAYADTKLRLQVDLAKDLIRAMVDKRIDAVKSCCDALLATFAEQARHFMAQQNKFAEAQITSKDPIERAGYQARLSEIDVQLAEIRDAGKQTFGYLSRVIMSMGAPPLALAGDDRGALQLGM